MRIISGLIAGVALLAAPWAAQAQLADCKVGDRVAMPAGWGNKYLQAVVVALNPPNYALRCKVHPLGYAPYADTSFKPESLKAPGTVMTEPLGGVVDDPYLLAAQGKQAYKASRVLPGHYQCATFSDRRLEARPSLEFTILDDGRYQDAFGASGRYLFDAGSGGLVFHGGALDGQRGAYTQASDPPVKSQPPKFVYDVSHDTCTLAMH